MVLKLRMYQDIMKVKRYAERRYLPHIKLTDKNPKITKNMTTNQVEK